MSKPLTKDERGVIGALLRVGDGYEVKHMARDLERYETTVRSLEGRVGALDRDLDQARGALGEPTDAP